MTEITNKERKMRNFIQHLIVLIILATIIGGITLYAGQVFAGGADDTFTCTKVEVKPCKAKVIVKYRTKTKVIERPVQQIVERTKTIKVKVPVVKTVIKRVVKNKPVYHKNRISLLIGTAYDSEVNVQTHLIKDMYGNVVDKTFSHDHGKRMNLGIQYQRDIINTPKYDIHFLLQYQRINGVSVGAGIGF